MQQNSLLVQDWLQPINFDSLVLALFNSKSFKIYFVISGVIQ